MPASSPFAGTVHVVKDFEALSVHSQVFDRHAGCRDRSHEGVALSNRLLLADAANLCQESAKWQHKQEGVMPCKRGLRSKVLICRVAFVEGFSIAEEHLAVDRVHDAITSRHDEATWQGPTVRKPSV